MNIRIAWVPSVIRHLLLNRGGPCTHGRQIRSFLHVADVVLRLASVLDRRLEGPVNIGSDERIALADLIRLLPKRLGEPICVQLGARIAPADEPPLLVPDAHRLHEVPWRPAFTLHWGIADTIAWWRDQLKTSRT